MRLKHIYILFAFCFSNAVWANTDSYEEHVLVSMRMIGHQLLLADGDSTSRVLPITKDEDRYKLDFSSPFSFEPDMLAFIVDNVLVENRVASSYIVEVIQCDSGLVVYSYEVGETIESSIMPCTGRVQPKGCYSVYLRILNPPVPFVFESSDETSLQSVLGGDSNDPRDNSSLYYILILGSIILFSIYGINRRPIKTPSHLVSIGNHLFDSKNMNLIRGNSKQDLTGKESDLLQLLYKHLNSTVDREVILKEVWRDEGAYIGRTLDVYISKLRKKFESDPRVNFINVRGIGYKMTME